MKIVQIISSLGNGGAEKFVIELSNELHRKKHYVRIISFKKTTKDMFFVEKIHPNIDITELNKNKGFSFKIFINLFSFILKYNPDQIHFHLDSTFLYIFPLTFIFRKKKFTYTIHSKLSKSNRKKFEILNKLFFMKKNIEYVCISKSIKQDFSKHFPRLKFNVVVNGINNLSKTENFNQNLDLVNSLKINHKTKVCLVVGKVVPVKNYLLLLSAFSKLKEQNVICIIIGNNSTEYYEKINKYKPNNVFFVGPKSDVSDFLILSDAFLMSSLNEGLPISALEAMYYSKPVITTPAGGMIDLIENKVNGFITKTFEVNEFVSTIKKFLLLDKANIDLIKKNNINKIKNSYTIEICCENYLKIFNKTK